MNAERGEGRLNGMVRDPHWIYCYWEVTLDALGRAARGRSPRFLETVRWVLRLSPSASPAPSHDDRSIDQAGSGEDEPYDVEVDAEARDWYLKVRPGTRYRVELGLVTAGGDFVPLASGGEVETPPGALGEIADGDWGPLRPELERLMARGLVGSSATSFSSMYGSAGVSADGQASGARASSAAAGGRQLDGASRT